MTKVFKSSFWVLFRFFVFVWVFVSIIVAALIGISGFFIFKLDKGIILHPITLIIALIVTLLISICLSFISCSRSVTIDETAVRLYKGKKLYKTFYHDKYEFTHFVRHSFGDFGIFSSRYLRVMEARKKRWKDYRLFFSKKSFEILMTQIMANTENNRDKPEETVTTEEE